MIRLRDIAERVQEFLETSCEDFIAGDASHNYIFDLKDVQTVYRRLDSPVHRGQVLPWLMCSFSPSNTLLEPFNIYPARYWALLRIHRQTSGLPELVTHIAPEVPSAEVLLTPHLYTSFSHSKNTETEVEAQEDDGEISLSFFHSGNLMNSDRSTLSAEFCLPGICEALEAGNQDSCVPGPVPREGASLYLGDLVFYNGGRTPDRKRVRRFLLNNIATAVVARYVRDIVRRTAPAA
jgi:hypothetical protein